MMEVLDGQARFEATKRWLEEAVLAERRRCAAIARDDIYCYVTDGAAGVMIAEEIERVEDE